MARRIRIVVGEGRTAQQGLLRFVLEGEGFDIVGEAKGTADLSSLIEEQRPDVVVLDDGIGVMAVSMVHEVSPDTKIVLVWPSAVVPIGGDARVEPAQILRDLGPAVEQVASVGTGIAGLTETFARPEWIDRVRKDPSTLREKLGDGKRAPKRPSVTRLQRRGRRLHPSGGARKGAESARPEEGVPAPVVVLPVGNGSAPSEPVLDLAGGAGSEGTQRTNERSEWNRRLGSLALSGAAAVSALVLALALGGGRVPASLVRGGGTLPAGVPGFVQSPEGGPFGGSLGGSGYNPVDVAAPGIPAPQGGVGGPGGGTLSPGAGGTDQNSGGDTGGGTVSGGGNGGGGNGGGTGTGGTGGGNGGGGSGVPGTGGEPGTGKADGGMPGKSAEHNPFGGPPSKLGITPAHGHGFGKTLKDKGSKHEGSQDAATKHAHKH